MMVALGWVAFALAGVAGAPHGESAKAQISYTVRMMEVDGVDWREDVYARLKPVTRQGSATVWTAPKDAMARLVSAATTRPASRMIQAPKVTAFSGYPATVQCRSNTALVTRAAWNGEEPVVPPEKVRIGWHTTVLGRKLDQGILVQIVFEDTVIRAVHHVNVSRAREEACCDSARRAEKDVDLQKASVDVPEIDIHEVLGEWLIPRGEVLLVSFGAHTVADENGKAVVRERLGMIEADPVADPNVSTGPIRIKPAPTPIVAPPATLPAPLPKVVLPIPVLPSRSYPQGVHADGKPADLPPLPADETEPDTPSPGSSEPMPSPQTKKPQQAKPAADPGMNKAEFAAPRSSTFFLPSLFLPAPSVGFQFLLPIKPLSFKLPLGQRLEIEIFGRIVPDPERRVGTD